jgi:hypothetical protein
MPGLRRRRRTRLAPGLLVAAVACGSLHAPPASAAEAEPGEPASAADEAALSTDAEDTALAGRPQQARMSEAERLMPLGLVLGPDGGRTVRAGRVYRRRHRGAARSRRRLRVSRDGARCRRGHGFSR